MRSKKTPWTVVLTCALALCASGYPAQAVTLTGDEGLDDGVLNYSGGAITGTLSGAVRTFAWAGMSGGLDLAGHDLTYSEAAGYTLALDLLNGSDNGAITNGGDISTSAAVMGGSTCGIAITNAGGISVASLTTSNADTWANSPGGSIMITHAGPFRATSVVTYGHGNGAAGSQAFVGDGTGAFTVAGGMDGHPSYGSVITIGGYSSVSVAGGIQTLTLAANWGAGGHVHIGSAAMPIGGAVSISGGIDTRSTAAQYNFGFPGNVAIHASGDITLDGPVNLNQEDANGWTSDGSLTLVTSGGAIGMGSLDMSKVNVVKLDYASTCAVTGAIENVATNYTTGAGTVGSPYVTTQTKLCAPAGRKVRYRPDAIGNGYLNGASYRLADLAGTAGSGGILTPRVATGSVIVIE